MADDEYDPASIRVLADLTPRKRPSGFLTSSDLTAEEMAAIMASKPEGEPYDLADIPEMIAMVRGVPDAGRLSSIYRAASRARSP